MPLARLVALFLGLAPLLILPGNHDFANLPQSAWLQTGAAALLLADACARSRPRLPFGALPLDAPLLALGLWGLASLAWAHNRYEWTEDALLWAAGGSVYVLVSRGLREPAQRHGLLRVLVATGVVLAALGLAQHLFALGLVPQIGPPAATFANRNIAAEVVVLLLPAAVALFLWAQGAGTAALTGAAAALMVGYLFHTLTRSAWLAAGAELTALALVVRRVAPASSLPGRRAWAAGASALALLLMSLEPEGLRWPGTQVAQLASETVEGASQSNPQTALGPVPAASSGKAQSVSIRATVWRDTMKLVRAHPWVGVGLGNFKVHFPAYSRVPLVEPASGRPLLADQAHNEYLQVAAELGLVGLGLFAWLAVRIGRVARRAARRAAEEPESAAPLVAAGVGVLGLVTLAAFGFPLHRALPPAIGGAYLGLLVGAAEPVSIRPAGRRPWPRLVVLGLALLGVTVWSERRIRADRHLLRLARADMAQDWERVVSEGREVQRSNPFRSLALFRLASGQIRRGMPDEAILTLGRIVAGYPYHRSALGNLGIARLQKGDLAGARECFERVLALSPEDSLARYRLGEVLEREGRRAEAREEFRRALAADPRNALYGAAVARMEVGGLRPEGP